MQCRMCEQKENVKNEQRGKLAKRAELPRVKLEYAPNCRAPIWHRVEVGRAELDCVKLARVKKDAPNWTGIARTWHKARVRYLGTFTNVNYSYFGRCLDAIVEIIAARLLKLPVHGIQHRIRCACFAYGRLKDAIS